MNLFHDIAFVTEKPGTEKENPKPLSGYEGKALRAALTAMDFNVDAVDYLSLFQERSVRRDPTEEVELAKERLLQEIEDSNPTISMLCGDKISKILLGKAFKGIKSRSLVFFLKTPNGEHPVMPISDPAILNLSPDMFRTLSEDLNKAKRIIGGQAPVIDPPYDNFELIETDEAFDRLMSDLREAYKLNLVVAVDIETASPDKSTRETRLWSLDPLKGYITTVGMSFNRNTARVINFLWAKQDPKRIQRLSDALHYSACSFHNGQFDVRWLRHNGIDCSYVFDTMFAHYLLDERQGTHSLKLLSTLYYNAPDYSDAATQKSERSQPPNKGGGPEYGVRTPVDTTDEQPKIWDTEDMEVLRKYNGADCDYTLRLTYDLKKEMEEEDPRLLEILKTTMLPAAKLFIELQEHGLLIDKAYLHKMGEDWKAEVREIEQEIYSFPEAATGYTKGAVNLNSPKQVAELLFDRLGLEPMVRNSDKEIGSDILARRTLEVKNPEAQEFFRTQSSKQVAGTKPRSTGVFMLYWLGEQHEIPLLIIRHRLLKKRISSYYDGIVNRMGEECRIRPSYRMHGTKTGRLSSSDVNIHGIPRDEEIKRMFIADPGYSLVYADYSQAEIRMVAHFAHDETLVSTLDAQDIHAEISKKLFNITEKEYTAMDREEKEWKRRAAKTIAFGLIYGRSAKGLAPQLGVTKTIAEAYMRSFFLNMPDVQKWIMAQKARAMHEKESVSLYGRRRRFDYWPSAGSTRNELLRQSVNAPIQSSVSDMCLLAMIRVHKTLRAKGIKTLIGPHIHDGYWFEVPTGSVQVAADTVRKEMSEVGFKTDVPFTCDVKVGLTWGDLHKVAKG